MTYLFSLFMETVLIHGGIGVGIAVATALFFWRRKTRRPLFRFGGEDPISLGTTSRWIAWFGITYTFEVVSSFHPNVSLYKELSLSLIEAASLTAGLFLVDRLAMIFIEPESHWRPRQISTETAVKENVAVAAGEVAPLAETPPALATAETVEDKTYIQARTEELKDSASEAVANTGAKASRIFEKVRGAATQIVESRTQKAATKRETKETERKERLERLSKLLGGH